MEPIQQQINDLHQKIDLVHQQLEHLHEKITHSLTNGNYHRHHQMIPEQSQSPKYLHYHPTEEDATFLVNEIFLDYNPHLPEDVNFSPQMQIQRLTAQLTAAYNRIADLEERLLSQRWHP
jgi:uncharacterized coiled-coil protein SlyX